MSEARFGLRNIHKTFFTISIVNPIKSNKRLRRRRLPLVEPKVGLPIASLSTLRRRRLSASHHPHTSPEQQSSHTNMRKLDVGSTSGATRLHAIAVLVAYDSCCSILPLNSTLYHCESAKNSRDSGPNTRFGISRRYQSGVWVRN